MLEEDVPPNGLPQLPQLTKLIICKYSLNKLNTYHVRGMLVKRKEHGVPLEVLDVRTCEGSEHAMQLLSESVGNVQRPAKTLKEGHPSFFDLEGRVSPFDEREEGTDDDEDDDDSSGPGYGYDSTDSEHEDEFDEDDSDSYID